MRDASDASDASVAALLSLQRRAAEARFVTKTRMRRSIAGDKLATLYDARAERAALDRLLAAAVAAQVGAASAHDRNLADAGAGVERTNERTSADASPRARVRERLEPLPTLRRKRAIKTRTDAFARTRPSSRGTSDSGRGATRSSRSARRGCGIGSNATAARPRRFRRWTTTSSSRPSWSSQRTWCDPRRSERTSRPFSSVRPAPRGEARVATRRIGPKRGSTLKRSRTRSGASSTTGSEKGASMSLQLVSLAMKCVKERVHSSRTPREMISRPKMSRNE